MPIVLMLWLLQKHEWWLDWRAKSPRCHYSQYDWLASPLPFRRILDFNSFLVLPSCTTATCDKCKLQPSVHL